MTKKRIGIIGFGYLGKHLVSNIITDSEYELAFLWNRTKTAFENSSISADLVLDDLSDFQDTCPDLVIEVAHPSITEKYGPSFLKYCDYLIGSPTALCNKQVFEVLQNSATEHGLYVPSGAFWGGEDIQKMSDAGKLKSLKVTMKKHPLSLKLQGYLKEKVSQNQEVILYTGCVRDVCALAPNNTNTMAAAAISAPCLGFDGVSGCLISDPKLVDRHIVEIEVMGFPKEDGSCFKVHTVRSNPAVLGSVTGGATCDAFWGSVKRVGGKGPGIHLC